MKTIQQEILVTLLFGLREKGLIKEEVFSRAKEAVLENNKWPDWFCTSGT